MTNKKEQICELLSQGESVLDISQQVGTSTSYVHRVRKGLREGNESLNQLLFKETNLSFSKPMKPTREETRERVIQQTYTPPQFMVQQQPNLSDLEQQKKLKYIVRTALIQFPSKLERFKHINYDSYNTFQLEDLHQTIRDEINFDHVINQELCPVQCFVDGMIQQAERGLKTVGYNCEGASQKLRDDVEYVELVKRIKLEYSYEISRFYNAKLRLAYKVIRTFIKQHSQHKQHEQHEQYEEEDMKIDKSLVERILNESIIEPSQ